MIKNKVNCLFKLVGEKGKKILYIKCEISKIQTTFNTWLVSEKINMLREAYFQSPNYVIYSL